MDTTPSATDTPATGATTEQASSSHMPAPETTCEAPSPAVPVVVQDSPEPPVPVRNTVWPDNQLGLPGMSHALEHEPETPFPTPMEITPVPSPEANTNSVSACAETTPAVKTQVEAAVLTPAPAANPQTALTPAGVPGTTAADVAAALTRATTVDLMSPHAAPGTCTAQVKAAALAPPAQTVSQQPEPAVAPPVPKASEPAAPPAAVAETAIPAAVAQAAPSPSAPSEAVAKPKAHPDPTILNRCIYTNSYFLQVRIANILACFKNRRTLHRPTSDEGLSRCVSTEQQPESCLHFCVWKSYQSLICSWGPNVPEVVKQKFKEVQESDPLSS